MRYRVRLRWILLAALIAAGAFGYYLKGRDHPSDWEGWEGQARFAMLGFGILIVFVIGTVVKDLTKRRP